jgi:uncharacterized protein (DUF58 family)
MSFVTRYLEPNLVERLNHLQLSARRVVEGSIIGHHRSPVKGASVEFRQHRFYTPGDEPRRLDWRVFARTDRPYIKEFDEETNLRCVLMLDCSGSMGYTGRAGISKHEYASKLVASLAYLMLAQTESVGMGLFSHRLDQWLAPRSGTHQLSRLIDLLERSGTQGPARVAHAMQQAADRLGRRSLVIAVSDFFAPVTTLREGLARLHHDRHEIILLQVLDRDEIEFPFKTWVRFRGLEGEKPLLEEPAMVRRMYLDNFRKHRRGLEELCRATGAEFYAFVTDRSLIDAITAFLHRRQVAAK